jgi:hypothetical protein
LYRYATAASRRLPDFIIVGAQKSGTTSLYAYLIEHPCIVPPIAKETSFFDQNFHRGLAWYRSYFPRCATAPHRDSPGTTTLTGESTAHYMFHPLAAERMARSLPGARILMLLRNPVDRAFSHYQMKVRRRQEPLTFDDAVDAEAERLAGEPEKIIADPSYHSQALSRYSYLSRGAYVEQISRLQSFFAPDQMLVLESDEFFKRTAEVFERVLAFLGLPSWQPAQFGNRFPGKYRDKMNDATRRRLVEYFAPHNERLYAHLGRRFDWDR